MKNIRAIVFDVDGTLLDTMAYSLTVETVYRSWYPASDIDHDFFLRAHAYPYKRTYEELGLPRHRWAAFRDAVNETASLTCEPQKLFPQMREIVHALREKGYRIGINTSREKAAVDKAKAVHPALFSLFEETLCMTVDQVERAKPAPDSLFLLLKRSGLKPDEVFFIGDSDYDKRCALGAGTPFGWAAWGWHFTPEAYDADADIRLETPADMLRLF